MVAVPDENGKSRSMRFEQAFLVQLARRGMQDDLAAANHALNAIKKIRAIYSPNSDEEKIYIRIEGPFPSTNDITVPLKMAVKLGRDGPNPRILLEPWLVEAALERFGDRQLSIIEQREVWDATRTPKNVKWPSWWTEYRGTGKRRPKLPLVHNGFHTPCVEPRSAQNDE
jgi:hypothetical protein